MAFRPSPESLAKAKSEVDLSEDSQTKAERALNDMGIADPTHDQVVLGFALKMLKGPG